MKEPKKVFEWGKLIRRNEQVDNTVERSTFQTRQEARQAIFEYIECFYNRVRRHSTLKYLSPVAYEQQMR